jgi:hypothetical protein
MHCHACDRYHYGPCVQDVPEGLIEMFDREAKAVNARRFVNTLAFLDHMWKLPSHETEGQIGG